MTGLVKLELFNKNGKCVKKIEDHNMLTNFLKDSFRLTQNNCLFQTGGYSGSADVLNKLGNHMHRYFGTLQVLGETVSEGFKVSFNAGLCSTLELVALISISLGIMNLLPIPVLDGGLILFALIAILVRKEVPPKIQYKIQIIGIIFIVFVFLIGTTGDVKYFINKWK